MKSEKKIENGSEINSNREIIFCNIESSGNFYLKDRVACRILLILPEKEVDLSRYDLEIVCSFQPTLIMIFGINSESIHDKIDEILLENGNDNCLTTWHDDELLDEVASDFFVGLYSDVNNSQDIVIWCDNGLGFINVAKRASDLFIGSGEGLG